MQQPNQIRCKKIASKQEIQRRNSSKFNYLLEYICNFLIWRQNLSYSIWVTTINDSSFYSYFSFLIFRLAFIITYARTRLGMILDLDYLKSFVVTLRKERQIQLIRHVVSFLKNEIAWKLRTLSCICKSLTIQHCNSYGENKRSKC